MKSAPVNSKFLISIHQPKLWLSSVLAILVFIVFCIWGGYEYGRYVSGFDQIATTDEIESLRSALDAQTAKKENALRDNARLSRGSDIQKDASGKVGESLAACEGDAIKMKEELTFYHNVVAPKKSKREIQVNKVSLSAANDGSYRYKVVLIQVGRHDRIQRGTVEISFSGVTAGGSEAHINLSKVSLDKKSNRQKFGFKYFQNFEGGIKFPQGFEPRTLYVKALPKSSKVPKVNIKYAWSDLIVRGSDAHVGQEQTKIN